MSNFWLVNLIFAALLMFTGIYCLLTMRNLIKLFIGVEIMAKGISLALIAAGAERHCLALAQSLVITFIVVEVCLAATALAIITHLYRHNGTLDVRQLNRLKG